MEFDGFVKPGIIIVDPAAHFLYQVRGNRQAVRYGVGVGRDGFAWSGKAEISTRVRLAGSQQIVAVAVMSDGSAWLDTADVVVIAAACGVESKDT